MIQKGKEWVAIVVLACKSSLNEAERIVTLRISTGKGESCAEFWSDSLLRSLATIIHSTSKLTAKDIIRFQKTAPWLQWGGTSSCRWWADRHQQYLLGTVTIG
eukprot:1147552-Pelagomonas_calceolata.AAC.3